MATGTGARIQTRKGYEPDRVDLRDSPASDEDHPRAGVEGRRSGHAFKLILAAQDRWRAINAPHLVALVRAGATFVNGKLAERDDDQQELATPSVETAA